MPRAWSPFNSKVAEAAAQPVQLRDHEAAALVVALGATQVLALGLMVVCVALAARRFRASHRTSTRSRLADRQQQIQSLRSCTVPELSISPS
jgi:hypothetical protein